MNGKPRKCVVTKLGLLVLAAAAAALVTTFVWQRVETGSFERGNGYVAPWWIKDVILYGTPIALVVLLAGAVYDSARYSAWKKRQEA
jgi:hypothetical protein